MVDELVQVRLFHEPVYPGLRHLGSVESEDATAGASAVICGENYDALQLLAYLHPNQVDAIYIDPPYNVGARDWKYNNDYVDLNDGYRHSKWLSMMERRLLLAQRLLAPDGVLVVTIDEHEYTHLGMLLERMFPDARRQMVTIVNNAAGVTQGGFSRVDEYAYFCFLGGSRPATGSDDLLSDEGVKTPIWRPLNRYSGTNVSAAKRPGLVYPIYIDTARQRIAGTGPTLDDLRKDGKVSGDLNAWRPPAGGRAPKGQAVLWPFKGDGSMSTWEVNPASLCELADDGWVRVRPQPNNGFSISYVKSGTRAKVATGEIPEFGREPDGGPRNLGSAERAAVPKTVWRRARHDAGKWGSRVLRELLGSVTFDYAKSPYAVLDTLRTIVGEKPDALVVDFFGGSGTTLHALAMLNSEDGGRRRCILVTNNEVDQATEKLLTEKGLRPGDREWSEHGVFARTTRPRIEAAFTGIGRDGNPFPEKMAYLGGRPYKDGFEQDVHFFELAYLDRDEVELGDSYDLVAPVAWLKAGGIGPFEVGDEPPWSSPPGAAYAVLFDLREWRAFIDHLKAHEEITEVFIVTDSDATFVQISRELPPAVTPSMLYRDFLRSFEKQAEPSA